MASTSSPTAAGVSGPALPRITIQFCTQCKWLLRAAYFAQELLSTFSTALGEVALQPTTGGIFRVELTAGPPAAESHQARSYVLWDRKTERGFPETKELKRRVRDVIDPARDLGHVDRDYHRPTPATAPEASGEEQTTAPGADAAVPKRGETTSEQPATAAAPPPPPPVAAVPAEGNAEEEAAAATAQTTVTSPSPPDLTKVTPTQLAAAAMGVPLYLLSGGSSSSSNRAEAVGAAAAPLPQAPHGVKPQIKKPPAEYTAEIRARLDERNRLKAELEAGAGAGAGGGGSAPAAAEGGAGADKCEDCE